MQTDLLRRFTELEVPVKPGAFPIVLRRYVVSDSPRLILSFLCLQHMWWKGSTETHPNRRWLLSLCRSLQVYARLLEVQRTVLRALAFCMDKSQHVGVHVAQAYLTLGSQGRLLGMVKLHAFGSVGMQPINCRLRYVPLIGTQVTA